MSPKQDAMDQLLGTWTNEYKVRKSQMSPEEKTATGSHTFTRILGGRFVQEMGTGTGITGFQHLSLYLHDTESDSYTLWYFTSTAHVSKGTGKWNAETRTLTTSADYGRGVRSTDTIHLKDDDTMEWSSILKDANGTLHYHLEGTSKRVKE